jgi:hypothetical protein
MPPKEQEYTVRNREGAKVSLIIKRRRKSIPVESSITKRSPSLIFASTSQRVAGTYAHT